MLVVGSRGPDRIFYVKRGRLIGGPGLGAVGTKYRLGGSLFQGRKAEWKAWPTVACWKSHARAPSEWVGFS